MKSLITISAVAGLALAAPSRILTRDDTQQLNVMIQQVKSTSETDIAVVKSDTSEILGYSCSSTLNTGAFADLPITADVDENGSGTLTVGSKKYQVHEDSETSGGITCARMFNDGESFLDCAVSVPSSLQFTAISDDEKASCFNTAAIPSMQNAYKAMIAQQAPPETTNTTSKRDFSGLPELDKRQCGIWSASSQVVGDGNPHQNYYLKQLSVSVFVVTPCPSRKKEKSETQTNKLLYCAGEHQLWRIRQLQRRPKQQCFLYHWMDSLRYRRGMAHRRLFGERQLDYRKHIHLQW